MREYLEGRIEYLKADIDDDMKRYRSYQHGIREKALKYFSEEHVEKQTDGQYLHPSSMGDETVWVRQMIDRANELKVEVWGKYQALRALLSVKWEMDKVPSTGVEVDDAARKIAWELRKARVKVPGLTLKKQAAEKDMWIAVADAYYNSLLKLGYTDEQIEGMVK